MIFFISFTGLAEEKPEINTTNQYIATRWERLNRTVDLFFTNQTSLTNDSSIFIYTSFYKRESEKIETAFDFQLKFDLPNTTKKLKIVIEKQQDDISNALSDTSAPESNIKSRISKIKNNYAASANYFLKQSKYFISSLRFGLRLDLPLNPYVKLELQKDFRAKYINMGISQKFILYRQEGFQNISQLSFNKKISKHLQLDLINSLVWTDESDIFLVRNNLVLYQDLGNEKTLSYSLGANAKLSPTYHYDSYDASISYRQILYANWLYGTLTTGADFSKTNHFDDDKFVQIRFDIFFKE